MAKLSEREMRRRALESVASRDWIVWYKATLRLGVHLERETGNAFGRHFGDICDGSNALVALVNRHLPQLEGYSIGQVEVLLNPPIGGLSRLFILVPTAPVLACTVMMAMVFPAASVAPEWPCAGPR